MKSRIAKVLGLTTMFLGAVVGATEFGTRTLSESQALTRAAPGDADTVDTKSLNLGQVVGFRVIVCAEATRTLTGGDLEAWFFNSSTGLWARNPDLDLTVAAVSARCQVFPDFKQYAKFYGDRVMFAATGVTVSGGTTVTVSIKALLGDD